jgi:hypothetical protein
MSSIPARAPARCRNARDGAPGATLACTRTRQCRPRRVARSSHERQPSALAAALSWIAIALAPLARRRDARCSSVRARAELTSMRSLATHGALRAGIRLPRRTRWRRTGRRTRVSSTGCTAEERHSTLGRASSATRSRATAGAYRARPPAARADPARPPWRAGSGHDRGPDEHRADGGAHAPPSDVRAPSIER